MIAFLLMNLIVGLSSFLLASRIFRGREPIDSLLSLLIFYFSQIILTQLALGILGILSIGNLILLNLIILLPIWLFVKDKKAYLSLGSVKDSIALVLKNRIIFFGICVVLGFGLIKVMINLLNPPFGWDSLNYHFTFAVEWLKHANLDTPITVFDDPSPSYYPINGSLWFLWLIFPFHNVFVADIGQVPFFLMAFLAVYNIAKKVGLNREFSFYSASLFLAIPNFFKQLQIAYVDVMVAALFLVCLNFLFALERDFSWQNTLTYSLGLGLLLGTKTIALPYSILLFLPFLYLCLKNINKSYLLLLSLLAIVVLGGFSYLRNFINTGNPLYPLDFKLLGRDVFRGVMDNLTYRAHFRSEDYRLSKLLFHEGLGAQTLIFVLPSLFLAFPIALIKKRREVNFNLSYFLLLPLFIYLTYRYIIPLANTRYLYPLLGIGMISGLYLFNALRIPRAITNILVLVCILSSMGTLAKSQELVWSIILTFLLFFIALPFTDKLRIAKPNNPKLMIILCAVIGLLILGLSQGYYLRNEFPRYLKMVKYSGFWPDAAKAWDWLNRNTSGNNIAYAGRPVPFPLYGSNFKNNVYYASVNKTDPAKLHYFAGSRYQWSYDFEGLHRNLAAPGNYRYGADYGTWLNNLLKRKTDYLFIYSLHQTKDIDFPIEDKWASAHPESFKPVFSNNTIHIYRIL